MAQFFPSESQFPRFSIHDLPASVHRDLSRLSLTEGELLFQEGEPTGAIYFLESGSVRLVNYTKSGQTIEHYSVGAGEFFAEVLLLLTACTYTAIAEKVSQVLVIPKSVWIEALRANHHLAVMYTGQLTARLYHLETILRLRGIRIARERVWSYLKIMAHPTTKVLYLDRPLKAIAQDLNLTPETLSRVLGQLTRERRIERNTKMIKLLE